MSPALYGAHLMGLACRKLHQRSQEADAQGIWLALDGGSWCLGPSGKEEAKMQSDANQCKHCTKVWPFPPPGTLPSSSPPSFHPLPGNPSSPFREGKASQITKLSVLLNSCLGGTNFETSWKASITLCHPHLPHPLCLFSR